MVVILSGGKAGVGWPGWLEGGSTLFVPFILGRRTGNALQPRSCKESIPGTEDSQWSKPCFSCTPEQQAMEAILWGDTTGCSSIGDHSSTKRAKATTGFALISADLCEIPAPSADRDVRQPKRLIVITLVIV